MSVLARRAIDGFDVSVAKLEPLTIRQKTEPLCQGLGVREAHRRTKRPA